MTSSLLIVNLVPRRPAARSPTGKIDQSTFDDATGLGVSRHNPVLAKADRNSPASPALVTQPLWTALPRPTYDISVCGAPARLTLPPAAQLLESRGAERLHSAQVGASKLGLIPLVVRFLASDFVLDASIGGVSQSARPQEGSLHRIVVIARVSP